MPESLSSTFLIGFLIYQAVITLGIVGYVFYLAISFSNYRNMVAKAFSELLKQNEELAKKVSQVGSAIMLMDSLFAPAATPPAPKPAAPKKGSLTTLHNYGKDAPKDGKDKSHLSVIDNPSKSDTPAVPKSTQGDSGDDKGN